LTVEAVREIFNLRPQLSPNGFLDASNHDNCPRAVAKRYGVTSKVVRDIWNRKTWVHATQELWTQKEKLVHLFETASPDRRCKILSTLDGEQKTAFQEILRTTRRRPGRPVGAKDFGPRSDNRLKAPKREQQEYFNKHECDSSAENSSVESSMTMHDEASSLDDSSEARISIGELCASTPTSCGTARRCFPSFADAFRIKIDPAC